MVDRQRRRTGNSTGTSAIQNRCETLSITRQTDCNDFGRFVYKAKLIINRDILAAFSGTGWITIGGKEYGTPVSLRWLSTRTEVASAPIG